MMNSIDNNCISEPETIIWRMITCLNPSMVCMKHDRRKILLFFARKLCKHCYQRIAGNLLLKN